MINITKTYLPNIDKYKKYVEEIYSTVQVTNNGPLLKRLEERLSKYLNVENLLLVSNGTLALQVAYKALGITEDVITTPFSFVATTSSILWEGLTPVFKDIDPNTFCIDIEGIEDTITDKG